MPPLGPATVLYQKIDQTSTIIDRVQFKHWRLGGGGGGGQAKDPACTLLQFGLDTKKKARRHN
jgi:hypothetical protein